MLGHLKIKPQRSLEDDMQLQSAVMSYGSSSVSVPRSLPVGTKAAGAAAAGHASAGPAHACGCAGAKPHACSCPDKAAPTAPASSSPAGSSPAASAAPAAAEPTLADFARMSVAEKLAYNKAKRDRIFG